jgi:hypothetical protein
MEQIKAEYKKYFRSKAFLFSLFSAIFFLGVALVINFYAAAYATSHASSSVTDIVLSNTRVYDVDTIFVYGPIFLTLFIIFIAFKNPRYAPFIGKSIAVFSVIRSIFITLTHISPFPGHAVITSTFFNDAYFTGIFTGDDLFFSGHTGIPFLMALIFWHNKTLRYVFLAISVLFGIIVLLGHLHYTIDVLSAFFITFSIYHINEFLFRKDKKQWDL